MSVVGSRCATCKNLFCRFDRLSHSEILTTNSLILEPLALARCALRISCRRFSRASARAGLMLRVRLFGWHLSSSCGMQARIGARSFTVTSPVRSRADSVSPASTPASRRFRATIPRQLEAGSRHESGRFQSSRNFLSGPRAEESICGGQLTVLPD